MTRRFWQLSMLLLLGISLAAGCSPQEEEGKTPAPTPKPGEPTFTPPPTLPPEQEDQVRLTADIDQVTALQPDGSSQLLPAPDEIFLAVGGGVDVDEAGRAILRFADLLTVEVLRDGELQIQALDIQEQAAFITVLQNGGALLNDFDPGEEIERRFTVQTEFATITATGTRFLLVREAGSPLEWIVGLDSEPGDLQVTADGVTKDVVSNQARWVAPIDEPSPGIDAEMGNVQDWIGSLQGGIMVDEIGDTIWAQADALLGTGILEGLPQIGEQTPLGSIQLTLLPGGEYSFEDCNGDGIADIAMVGGNVELDFRQVLNRVRAVDVTVYKRAGGGFVEALDPARAPYPGEEIPPAADQLEVLSLRSEAPYHYASLSLDDGCFLGVSLTPPEDTGESGLPRSPVEAGEGVIIDSPQENAADVINDFVISGRTTLSPGEAEGTLFLYVETPGGQVLDRSLISIGNWDPDQGVSTFRKEVFVESDLPAEIRLRVRYESFDNARVVAEDSILLSPLNPDLRADRRPPTNGRLEALRVDAGGYPVGLDIDGSSEDWDSLQALAPGSSTSIFNTVYDIQCSVEHPGGGGLTDLAGSVLLAYDTEFLYVNFTVFDDGYDGYQGDGQFYFNGDAPQLLLDLDLPGDFADQKLSPDDIQLDFLPGRDEPGDGPRVAFWQLNSGDSWVLEEALVESRWTGVGYFLEAAIPWSSLGISPEPGLTFGVAASISDNDTPGTDVQECMISTAPARDWRNPTTWGTLTLQP